MKYIFFLGLLGFVFLVSAHDCQIKKVNIPTTAFYAQIVLNFSVLLDHESTGYVGPISSHKPIYFPLNGFNLVNARGDLITKFLIPDIESVFVPYTGSVLVSLKEIPQNSDCVSGTTKCDDVIINLNTVTSLLGIKQTTGLKTNPSKIE